MALVRQNQLPSPAVHDQPEHHEAAGPHREPARQDPGVARSRLPHRRQERAVRGRARGSTLTRRKGKGF